MRIEQFDPAADQDLLRSCYGIFAAAQPVDDPNVPAPSFRVYRGWWTDGFDGDPKQAWAALGDSGEPLGACIAAFPRRENLASAFLSGIVAVPARRQGVGTALLVHAAEQSRLADRQRLVLSARIGSPGEAFAAHVGAQETLREARRVLDIGPGLAGRLPGLRAQAEAHASGYALRQWTGATPGDVAEQVCTLYTAMGDAPHDENFESAVWDLARLRQADERLARRGTRDYSVAAIHAATGEMAALTEVTVDPDAPGWGFQGMTAVTRPHRGHRLGLLVKAAMLEWLLTAEPDLRAIVTENAVVNDHMIGINEKIGFRVTDHFQYLDLDLATAPKLASAARA